MEEKFLNKLRNYLAKPENERDLNEGAIMLLQLNKNRILHQNITRNPKKYAEKLFYELNKYLKIHSDNMTIAGIIEMEKEVPVIQKTTLQEIEKKNTEGEITLGKRADHEELPESIKALWIQNGDIAKDLRSLHEKLKLMSDLKPCDRYDTLQQLIEADKKYRSNWEKYDKYQPDSKQTESEVNSKGSAIDAHRVSANRKFLSLNKGKLAKYKEANDLPKYHSMLEKIQERYEELKAAGYSLAEKQLSELVELGLKE